MSYSFEDLIESVQRHPMIWERSHPQYNNYARKLSWNYIAKELKTNEVQIRKSWKYLVDQYRKELNAKRFMPYTNEPIPSAWAYYKKMSFLKDEFITRQRRRKIRARAKLNAVSNNPAIRESDAVTQEDNNETNHNSNISHVKTTADQHEATHVKSMPVRYSSLGASNAPNENYDNIMVQCNGAKNEAGKSKSTLSTRSRVTKADMILRRLQHLRADMNDEDHLFFMSILPIVKTLSPVKKVQFRGKINEWLLKIFSDADPLNSVEQKSEIAEDFEDSTWGPDSEDNKEAVMREIIAAGDGE